YERHESRDVPACQPESQGGSKHTPRTASSTFDPPVPYAGNPRDRQADAQQQGIECKRPKAEQQKQMQQDQEPNQIGDPVQDLPMPTHPPLCPTVRSKDQ